MKRVYIYCEGQTEETFVNEVLAPYFYNINICVLPIIHTTKRTAKQKFVGGVTTYAKIKTELHRLCSGDQQAYVTTMFDYYAMPDDTPGIQCKEPDIYLRMSTIEQAINFDIGAKNLFFNFMLHEFEGILFSDPDAFRYVADQRVVEQIQNIRNAAATPEHINNSPLTAPSKRLEAIIPKYAKVKNGAILSKAIGIDKMLTECQHFKQWIERIKNVY